MDTSWLEDSECQRHDPEMFFGRSNGLTGAALAVSENAAKAVCDRCGVKDECLLWALATKQTHGVWGGLTESERANLVSKATA